MITKEDIREVFREELASHKLNCLLLNGMTEDEQKRHHEDHRFTDNMSGQMRRFKILVWSVIGVFITTIVTLAVTNQWLKIIK